MAIVCQLAARRSQSTSSIPPVPGGEQVCGGVVLEDAEGEDEGQEGSKGLVLLLGGEEIILLPG